MHICLLRWPLHLPQVKPAGGGGDGGQGGIQCGSSRRQQRWSRPDSLTSVAQVAALTADKLGSTTTAMEARMRKLTGQPDPSTQVRTCV